MTAPGVGPVTALCFQATIDDPTRFSRSRNVGAYVGLTTRRYSSGEVDWIDRISKCGDPMLRSYLYEVAGVLLTRVQKWSALKACGLQSWGSVGVATLCAGRKLPANAPIAALGYHIEGEPARRLSPELIAVWFEEEKREREGELRLEE